MISANRIDEIKSQAFLGVPSNLQGIANVYPLTMSEILEIGMNEYNKRLGTLLLTEIEIQKLIKEKIQVEVPLEEIKPLEYLLISAEQSDIFLLELQTAFSTFLKEEVLLLPEMKLIVVDGIEHPERKRFITEENFAEFQTILRVQNKKKVDVEPPKEETFGERKMRLLRERVEEAKRKQNDKNAATLLFSEILEIAAVYGIDVQNSSYYKFYSLLPRYQLREKWEQDLEMLCAGASSDNIKAKYWGESSKEN